MLSPSFVVLSSAGRRLLVGFKVRSKADCPTGFAYGGIVSEKGESVKWKMGGSVVLRGETMENHAKLGKTIQNYGKLEKGVWVFLFITTIKKKKIKKQLLVADGGV